MNELPEGLGRFASGSLVFEVDDGYSLVSLEPDRALELDEQQLDRRLGSIPGPIASWLLARLTALAGGTLALDDETVEVCEGAVYVIDFVVKQDGAPAGKVQLQAGCEGAALLGVVGLDPQLVIDRFVAALVAEPDQVAGCRVRARDPSWPEGEIAEYGFDGARYL